MTAPSPATAPLAEVFAAHLREGTSATVDVRQGKRRWIFTIEDGQLVGTRSNLKSDHLDTLRGQKPDMADDKLRLLQAIRRFKGAVSSGETPTESAFSEPKERVASSTGLVVIKGLVSALDEQALLALVEATLPGPVVAQANFAATGASGKLVRFLDGRAGSHDHATDLAEGAPGRKAEALAVVWLAGQLGVLSIEDAEAAPAPGLDFSDLISGALAAGDEAKPATDAEAPAPGPPEAAPAQPEESAAPVMSIEDDEDDEDDDTAPPAAAPPNTEGGHGSPLGIDPGAPSADVAIHIEAVDPDTPVATRTRDFTFPSFQAAAPAPDAAAPSPGTDGSEDPRSGRLRILAERLEMAETHFDVLDVDWQADLDAFRTAHLRLAQELHPDRFADAPEDLQDLATGAFDKVRAAWEVLGDDEKRAAYIDKVIHGIKTEDELAMEQVEAYWAAEAEFKRGLALFNNGRLTQAHEHFEAAIAKVPDELEFRAYWAFTSFQKHKTDPERAEEFKDMLKDVLDANKAQDRKLDGGWVLLGRMYKDLDNEQAAKRCFVQALRINAANGDANRELRRLQGGGGTPKAKPKPAKDGGDKKSGFFGRLFGGKK